MFHIKQQQIGHERRHAVVGEVGHQLVTVLATCETQACEIARALNEAAGIEIEDATEIVSATALNAAMGELLSRHYNDLRDAAPEMTAAEQLAEAQLRG